MLLALGAVLAATALLASSGYLISRAAERPNILALSATITVIRGLGLTRAVLRYLERLASHDLALRVLARLRVSFYAAVAPLGAAALARHRRGELLSRFVADVDSLQDLYLRALAPPLVAALMIAAVAIGAWLMLPACGAVLAACLLVTAIVVPATAALIAASAGRRQAPVRAALASELVESLRGSVELAVAGRSEDRVGRLHRLSLEMQQISARDAVAAALGTTLGSLMSGLTVILLLLVAIPAVHAGQLNAVLLAALVLLALGAFEGLVPLPTAARTLRNCAESARRLNELSAGAPAVRDPERPRTLPAGAAASICMQNVWLRYGQHEPWLVEDLNLRFEPGCRMAVTGASGVGKSTLMLLLVRFMDPTRGRVCIGGIDARELALDEVRKTVVLIAQDAHVFNTTVRENLLLARREATEQELWQALAAVQLEQWVRSLPDGLDTLVGEEGEFSSGGQRQRLTLARAFVSDADFIVLDEPTAQLDTETASELMQSIDMAAKQRGLIVVTHRQEGLERFDRVLELHDGKLDEAVVSELAAQSV